MQRESTKRNVSRPFAWVLLGLLAGSGCAKQSGPELGTVHGQVTLDGKPLPKALVTFQPIETDGTYSAAVTDDKGQYELVYSRSRRGAITGQHVVRITTAISDDEDESGRPRKNPEILPVQYHQESELNGAVQSGTNKIDFALSSAVSRGKTPRAPVHRTARR